MVTALWVGCDKTAVGGLHQESWYPYYVGLCNQAGTKRYKNRSCVCGCWLPVLSNKRKKKATGRKKGQSRGAAREHQSLGLARLIHQCIYIFLDPLRQADEHGLLLELADGTTIWTFVRIAQGLFDNPEADLQCTKRQGATTYRPYRHHLAPRSTAQPHRF